MARRRLFQQRILATALDRALVGRAVVDAMEKIHQARARAVEAGAGGGRFQRKAHLDVGGGEVGAGKPRRLAQFRFQVVEVGGDLRFDVRALDLAGDAARDRFHKERRGAGFHPVEHQLHQQRRHGRAFGIVQEIRPAAPGLRGSGRRQAAVAISVHQVFHDGAGLGHHHAVIDNHWRLAERMDGAQLGRRQHGLGVALVAHDLVVESQLFQQPQHALALLPAARRRTRLANRQACMNKTRYDRPPINTELKHGIHLPHLPAMRRGAAFPGALAHRGMPVLFGHRLAPGAHHPGRRLPRRVRALAGGRRCRQPHRLRRPALPGARHAGGRRPCAAGAMPRRRSGARGHQAGAGPRCGPYPAAGSCRPAPAAGGGTSGRRVFFAAPAATGGARRGHRQCCTWHAGAGAAPSGRLLGQPGRRAAPLPAGDRSAPCGVDVAPHARRARLRARRRLGPWAPGPGTPAGPSRRSRHSDHRLRWRRAADSRRRAGAAGRAVAARQRRSRLVRAAWRGRHRPGLAGRCGRRIRPAPFHPLYSHPALKRSFHGTRKLLAGGARCHHCRPRHRPAPRGVHAAAVPPADESARHGRARGARQRRPSALARHRVRAGRDGIDGRDSQEPGHARAAHLHGLAHGLRRARSAAAVHGDRRRHVGQRRAAGRPVRIDRAADGPVAHVELSRRRRWRQRRGKLRAGVLRGGAAHGDGLLDQAPQEGLPVPDRRRASLPGRLAPPDRHPHRRQAGRGSAHRGSDCGRRRNLPHLFPGARPAAPQGLRTALARPAGRPRDLHGGAGRRLRGGRLAGGADRKVDRRHRCPGAHAGRQRHCRRPRFRHPPGGGACSVDGNAAGVGAGPRVRRLRQGPVRRCAVPRPAGAHGRALQWRRAGGAQRRAARWPPPYVFPVRRGQFPAGRPHAAGVPGHRPSHRAAGGGALPAARRHGGLPAAADHRRPLPPDHAVPPGRRAPARTGARRRRPRQLRGGRGRDRAPRPGASGPDAALRRPAHARPRAGAAGGDPHLPAGGRGARRRPGRCAARLARGTGRAARRRPGAPLADADAGTGACCAAGRAGRRGGPAAPARRGAVRRRAGRAARRMARLPSLHHLEHHPHRLDMLPEPHNSAGGWQGMFRRGHPDLVLLRYALAAIGQLDGLLVSHLDAFDRAPGLRWCAGYAAPLAARDAALCQRDAQGAIVELRCGARGDLDHQSDLTALLMDAAPQLAVQPIAGAASFIAQLEQATGLPVAWGAYGPTWETVRRLP
uniref:Uncharacterized protein n=1 Tax=Tanacetum cinerariifolium TaxID=118510 RepID=A0A699GDZ2_TANCI|nr:hypothetical protein [Tanacetum cinerariifolium]